MRTAPIFIVGAPRSGTTLVQVMLDQHPRIALPPQESPWIAEFAPPLGVTGGVGPWRHGRRLDPDSAHALVERIVRHPRFAAWDTPEEEVHAAVGRLDRPTYAGVVAAVFSTYARRRGKPRWGDKTPDNAVRIGLLARMFREAQFIHVIRDGRDASASIVEQGWGPRAPGAAALWWRHNVAVAMREGRRLEVGRYVEVRLERLVAEPERILRGLCEALGEEYAPQMLSYHDVISSGPYASRAGHLVRPPTPGLRDWRAQMSPRQQQLVEAACRPSLRKLGYLVRAPSGRPVLERLLTLVYLVYGSGRELAVRARLRTWR